MVNDDDWDFLTNIRNETKEFHQNTSSFTNAEYKKYIESQLNQNKKNKHWTIWYENKPMGHAKIINQEIGYILSSEFRQKGMMKFVFQQFELEAQKLEYEFILQNIKTNNPISVWSSIKNEWKMIGLEFDPSTNLSRYNFKKDIVFKIS